MWHIQFWLILPSPMRSQQMYGTFIIDVTPSITDVTPSSPRCDPLHYRYDPLFHLTWCMVFLDKLSKSHYFGPWHLMKHEFHNTNMWALIFSKAHVRAILHELRIFGIIMSAQTNLRVLNKCPSKVAGVDNAPAQTWVLILKAPIQSRSFWLSALPKSKAFVKRPSNIKVCW